MTKRKDPWKAATREGSRREQLRGSLRLTIQERIRAIADMQEVSDALARSRAEGRLATPGEREKRGSTDALANGHFHRFWSDKKHHTQPDARGNFLRLTFPEAIPELLALGFGCHFGLGMFRADEGDS